MKIKLKSVNVSAVQNLAENQLVSFSGPGLYGIIGQNLDDGGSNASGKSSLTRAITVGLVGPGYVGITNKGLKNRILGVSPRIVQEWEVDDKAIFIDRTIGGKLIVEVDGVPLTGKSDEIQVKLDTILGITPEHFIHLTHKMQESFGGFLLMKDGDKKDFLGSFFDTSKIDKASAENDANLKTLSTKHVENAERLKLMVNGLLSLKTEVDSLTEKVSRFTSTEFLSYVAAKKSELAHKEIELESVSSTPIEDLLKADTQYCQMMNDLDSAQRHMEASVGSSTYQDTINKLSSEAAQLRVSINAPITIPSDLNMQLQGLESSLATLKAQQFLTSKLLTQKGSKEQEFKKLELKATALVQDKCSTCGQSVSTEIFQKIKDGMNAEITQAVSAIDSLNKKIEASLTGGATESDLNGQKNSVLNDIAAFKASQNKDHLKSMLSSIESNINAINAEKNEIEKSVKNTLASLEYFKSTAQKNYGLQISKLQAELGSLQKDIQNAEKEAVTAKELLTGVNTKYQTQLQAVSEVEQSISQTAREVSIRTKISEILSRNGFVGYIFDSILEEINSEVNENVKQIPVISRLSMYFTPDHTVKSTGAVNKNITSKIFDNGEEIAFETLSGSEKESILTAVDVAVDTILCSRLGVDINYKIFDEQFGWVDGEHKEHLLEFLKNKYRDKIVLIVDHGSELNAAIDRKIIVTKQNGIATVSCQTAS